MNKDFKEKLKILVDYIKEIFPGPMKFHFTYDLVQNVIEENLLRYYVGEGNLDKAMEYLADMLPDVSKDELLGVIEFKSKGE